PTFLAPSRSCRTRRSRSESAIAFNILLVLGTSMSSFFFLAMVRQPRWGRGFSAYSMDKTYNESEMPCPQISANFFDIELTDRRASVKQISERRQRCNAHYESPSPRVFSPEGVPQLSPGRSPGNQSRPFRAQIILISV